MINNQIPLNKGIVRKFIKGYKFPIYPNESQVELLEKTFGCCRYVWNTALAESKAEYEYYLSVKDHNPIGTVNKSNMTGFSFVNRLIKYKANPESQWLYEVSSDIMQQTMLHLGTAFSTFFKNRKGYPNFKKKFYSDSITLTKNVFRFKDNQFYMAKSKDPVAIGFSRDLPSDPSSCVISRTPTGKYFISFICIYTPTKTSGMGKIGIDLGLKDFLVTSDNLRIANPKHLTKQAKNLKRKQQKLSRSKKGSKNRTKARLVVAKIHESVANQRNTFQHQLSRKLINENQVIGIEKLLVKNMVKNHKLSKAISAVGWSSFVNKLIYKAIESQHCNIVQMDTWYPSTHICSACETKLDYKLKLSDRVWKCPTCHTIHDRDINASTNIRNEAMYQLHQFGIDTDGKLVLATRH